MGPFRRSGAGAQVKQPSGGYRESAGLANSVRLALVCLGVVIVGVAIVLAVRAPSVSSETETFNGPAAGGAVPAKVERVSERPSDTFLAALLALGGVLVAAGAFYPRVSSVEGPGFKVGLAELTPEVTERLREGAQREAEAGGNPEKAPDIANEAEQMLLERFATRYPIFPARTPYQTTYALGHPMQVAPALTESDIDEAVKAAASEVVSRPPAGGESNAPPTSETFERPSRRS